MNIAQVATQFDLTAATLRYYERVGLIPPVNRKESGIRDYDEEDIKWIEFIKCMRNAGLTIESLIEYTTLFIEGERTIEALKQYTKWREMGDETIPERMDLLEKRKCLVEREIQALQQNLDILNRKITYYKDDLKGNKYEFVLYPNERAKL